MLYPKMTASRMVFDLNGIWDFKLLKGEKDFGREETRPIPVPSAYNDIYPAKEFADHVGDMVYQRTFTVTAQMNWGRMVLRFGGVTHKAEVYLNGELLGRHAGGFLPFSFEISKRVKQGENLLTVFVNNVVDYSTLPCGRLVTEEFPGIPPKTVNLPNFDFYNYSGIMRPVWLYTTPEAYIQDIAVKGEMSGTFYWKVKKAGEGSRTARVIVKLIDAGGKCIFEGFGEQGTGRIDDPVLWDTFHPCLYGLKVCLMTDSGCIDEYTEEFGFREISIKNCRVLLNQKPLYLKGFGKHEEGGVRGRGTDVALMIKDLGLLKWIGANSFRTSHYPNSEEMMQLCDKMGILVIDEAPAVGLNTGFTATGLLGGDPVGTWGTLMTGEHHRKVMEDLVDRDKNHPCVIAWSVANEPASQEEGAKEYFEPLVKLTRERDFQGRPVTIVTYEGSAPDTCKVAELCDFLMLNRYRGWYDTEGNMEGAAARLKAELERFHDRCPDKPIMLGEYGADTIAGLHDINGRLFSEEYQLEFIRAYGEVFDKLPYITGEHVWVFADFATAENIKRVDGNKKGIFTRDRRPKSAAYFLKNRWSQSIKDE